MPKVLTQEQIEHYDTQGYLFPLPAVSPERARAMRDKLDAFQAESGMSMNDLHFKAHLLFTWSYQLSREPVLLDVMEDLLGPNLLVFASKFWIKGARDGSYVSWHQDSAYFGLDPHELVTAWVALTDANCENGCMKVIPGSHRGRSHSHIETFHEKNLLARGQVIEGLDDATAVEMPLTAGQFSIHHERMVHSSPPNMSDDTRIGLALFYIPTHVRSTIGRRTACLVRGVDEYGHWDADPVPRFDGDPLILEHIGAAHRRYVDPSVAQEAAAGE